MSTIDHAASPPAPTRQLLPGTLCPAMVTPMRPDGSVDFPGAERLALHLVESGCDAILVSGTTGESPTTSLEEKDELTARVANALNGRAYLLAGAGSNDTKKAVEAARRAADNGADGLLVVTPYYNRPTQRGVLAHLEAVAGATSLPITLYDIPGRTGLALSDETLEECSTWEPIVAVKDATGNAEQGLARMRRTGLAYYSGDDALNLQYLAGGASGVISVVAHAGARYYRQMIDALKRGDEDEAREVDAKLAPLVEAIMGGGQGAVMAKAALVVLGKIESASVRLPLLPAETEEVAQLRTVLGELD